MAKEPMISNRYGYPEVVGSIDDQSDSNGDGKITYTVTDPDFIAYSSLSDAEAFEPPKK